MSVNVKSVLSSNIKTRWREPFASEAINKKGVGTISPGVYRGLILEETSPPVDLTVTVAGDPAAADHVAIAETTNGFSVSYVNSGGDFNIDLSSAALLSQTVVITLELEYSVGADTVGNYVAYTVAEYDALSAAVKDGIVTLGTVVVPGSGAIPQANISPNRRSSPNDRPVGQPQMRLTKNGGFEVADDGASQELSFRHWRSVVTAGGGDANLVSHVAESNSGTKSVELDVLGAGSFSFQLTQDINVPVLEGDVIRARMFKKALIAANSGTATLGVSYRDVDGNATGAQTVAFAVDGVDAAFTEAGELFVVPAGAYELAFIEVKGTTLNYPGAGSSLLIDDVNLFIERTSANQDLDHELRGSGSIVGALTFEQPGESYASVGAALSFKNTDPSSGALELSRKDGSVSLLPPNFALKGQLDRLGEDLIGSTANAELARIVAPASVFAGVEYTLMWESVPSGEKGHRLYVSPTGTVARTVNAKWDNTLNQWSKDVNGIEASLELQTNALSTSRYQISGTNVWADGAWVKPPPPIYESVLNPTTWRESGSWVGPDGVKQHAEWINLATSLLQTLQMPLIGHGVGDTFEEASVYINDNSVNNNMTLGLWRMSSSGGSSLVTNASVTNNNDNSFLTLNSSQAGVPHVFADIWSYFLRLSYTATGGSALTVNYAKYSRSLYYLPQ